MNELTSDGNRLNNINKRLDITDEIKLKIQDLVMNNPGITGREVAKRVGSTNNKDYQRVCFQIRRILGKESKIKKIKKVITESNFIESKTDLLKRMTRISDKFEKNLDSIPETITRKFLDEKTGHWISYEKRNWVEIHSQQRNLTELMRRFTDLFKEVNKGTLVQTNVIQTEITKLTAALQEGAKNEFPIPLPANRETDS